NTNCPTVATVPNIEGQFLLGVHIKGTPDNTIIQTIIDFQFQRNPDGTGVLAYQGSSLKLPDRIISAGPPPAPQFMTSDMPVSHGGCFDAPLAGTLPGDANPIFPGSMAPVDGVQHGQIMSADFVCGTLSGKAGSADLTGSTFAAERITP